MRAARWVALGVVTVLAGAALGFLSSLLRPRRYAEIPAPVADAGAGAR